jgi:hypothetical protein
MRMLLCPPGWASLKSWISAFVQVLRSLWRTKAESRDLGRGGRQSEATQKDGRTGSIQVLHCPAWAWRVGESIQASLSCPPCMGVCHCPLCWGMSLAASVWHLLLQGLSEPADPGFHSAFEDSCGLSEFPHRAVSYPFLTRPVSGQLSPTCPAASLPLLGPGMGSLGGWLAAEW